MSMPRDRPHRARAWFALVVLDATPVTADDANDARRPEGDDA